MATIDEIKEQLASVPLLPGCYLWKNAAGEVIYVGKANQLRNRMRQYVMGQDERLKIPLMLQEIASFDYVVTKNEYESLVLEKNLIQQYRPRFNADFKDDKSYPFIAITKGDVFPAIKYTREHRKPDTRYFGPYTDSRGARELIDIARKLVPICSASCNEWKRTEKRLQADPSLTYEDLTDEKVCFDCHVGIGPGACCGKISPEEYAQNVKRVERFLAGSHREFIAELQQEMAQAASNLEFEKAGRIKSRIDLVNSLTDKQHAVSSRNLDADVIGLYRQETISGVQVLVVREGRVINSLDFVLNKGLDAPDQELMHSFLLRYYDQATSIPREVILAEVPEDHEVMEGWLTERLASVHGAKVRFVAPAKGEKHDLLKMAQDNARHSLMRYMVRTSYEDKRTNEALLQLESALALDRPPMRIECYDISTIHGRFSVASMVVFTNGRPDKKAYRRFKIRMESDEANDFAMMSEVLARRFAPERVEDERFGTLPDLLIVDGGKPQLTAAMQQLEELGITTVSLAGLAKRDEELFVPWSLQDPVVLPMGSASLYLVKRVRDEAHRFAITFHRELRDKAMTASILDEVPGIGPKRKKALYKHFGSLKKLRQASLQEICDTRILPTEVANDLYQLLRLDEQGSDQSDANEQGSNQLNADEQLIPIAEGDQLNSNL